jgi:cytochrome c oxidase cbb3-type subunit 3
MAKKFEKLSVNSDMERDMLAWNRVICGLLGLAALMLSHSGLVEAASSSVLKIGEEQFDENCSVCHQADAIGEPGVAPSLTNPELLAISSDKFLMGTIRDGREDTGMPPFAHLGRKNVQAIVAYLRSHARKPNRAEEVDGQPDAHGDPRLGKQWYNYICSTCHGLSGDGYDAGGTGTAIGLPGFLDKASDGFIRETIKHGRSNTRMLAFQGPAGLANLSDQEVDDIIVYLRSLAKR